MFSRLCVLGSGAISFIFWVNSWASLYAGAPLQFTTGRIGFSGLCSLIRPLMVGAVGFKFKYFHLESGGDECFAVVHDFSHMGLQRFCGVLR